MKFCILDFFKIFNYFIIYSKYCVNLLIINIYKYSS
jgi:hypothetical protein